MASETQPSKQPAESRHAGRTGRVKRAQGIAGRIKKSVSLGAGASVLDRHAGGNVSAYVDQALVEKGERDELRQLVDGLIDGQGRLDADDVLAGETAYSAALARLDAGQTA